MDDARFRSQRNTPAGRWRDTTFGNFGSPDPVSQPSFESIEEFTANILTTKAEFAGQGQITSVTRGGTNDFHGSLFWYARNSALDARNPFGRGVRPFQNIHNFGGSLSGPIRKDRTFFFGNFDTTRGVRGYTFNALVPTASAASRQLWHRYHSESVRHRRDVCERADSSELSFLRRRERFKTCSIRCRTSGRTSTSRLRMVRSTITSMSFEWTITSPAPTRCLPRYQKKDSD